MGFGWGTGVWCEGGGAFTSEDLAFYAVPRASGGPRCRAVHLDAGEVCSFKERVGEIRSTEVGVLRTA